MNAFQQRPEEFTVENLLSLYDDFTPQDTFIDPFFEPINDFLYTEDYTHLLPYFSSPSDQLLSIFPPDDLDCYQYPKRQKCDEDLFFSDFTPNCFDEYPMMNTYLSSDCVSELLFPMTEVPINNPPVYLGGNYVESPTNTKSNGGCLSAQSVAARQRRKKISEKTQELGKLIPGGNKMNTAEMFHAAFKYVKYLQAQVGLLDLMGSIQESEGPPGIELLASPIIQEKLYSEEKCLVPTEFVKILAKDHEIQSNPSISKCIDQLIKLKC